MKLAFSVKLQTKNLLLLKIKIKQSPNKVIFKYIHQNISTYPKSKKSALINNYEKIVAYSQQSEQSEDAGEQV